ncbi:FBD-associated F-box protein At5g56370-like [Lycium ferocissimum]|uniref:FBD-associated F-box protein At5g56370-like n=1 Tax=Lycium ferocissimum TaxID=112874 RepID=UPI0028153D0E|nr:FBD-associated F-box protein At5g56370-like [Lycium ferocissimum]
MCLFMHVSLLSTGLLVLPVLTLGAIAIGLNYYVVLKKRQALMEQLKEKDSIDQVYDAKEDYFSQLPDDLLPSMLAYLPIHDAARTSILSRRWKHLFASMPMLKFKCLDMSGIDSDDHSCCPDYQQKFLKGVNQLLQLYSGRRVAHIEMAFCYGRKFSTAFDQLMCSISRVGVERLSLNFRPQNKTSPMCGFSFELLSQASSLKHLFLTCCVVQPSSKVNFLRTISLEYVFLRSGQLEVFYPLVRTLSSYELNFVHFLLRCVSGRITSFIFFTCNGVEEIDLRARNLRTFECSSYRKVRFYFSFVPELEYVMIDLRQSESMPYIFGDFARDLPAQIKSLRVRIGPSEVYFFPREMEIFKNLINFFPREIEIFKNLRQLHLVLVDTNDYDILKFSPLLRACPFLQRLSLDLTMIRWSAGRGGPLLISPTCHTELKEVAFCGFHGISEEIEFALYIMRSAMVLERMFLSQRFRCYSGFGHWENMFFTFDERRQNSIQRQLCGEAISRKAVVIFQ